MNETQTNSNGSTVERSFHCHRERYHYDGERCAGAGWQQYDTDQDAWYFGVWVNRSARQIMTYAEGDEALVTSPTDEVFAAELQALNGFHGTPPPAAVGYDADGTRTEYYDEDALFGRAVLSRRTSPSAGAGR